MTQRPLWLRFVGFPDEKLGWTAVLLALGLFVFFGLLRLIVAMGYRGGATFWSNPPLALCVLAMGVCGLGGGLMAVYSMVRAGERSVFVLFALFLGCFTAYFIAGELAGHG